MLLQTTQMNELLLELFLYQFNRFVGITLSQSNMAIRLDDVILK